MKWLLSLIDAIMRRLYPTAPQPAPEVKIEPVEAPVEPVREPFALLYTFCAAIRDYEGGPGDLNYRLNNPGNFRPSAVGYAKIYGNVQTVMTASGPFAKFPTYELGWLYLQNIVKERAAKHPSWTLYDFFNNYSPTSDGNFPATYARFVAKRCGVSPDMSLSELFG